MSKRFFGVIACGNRLRPDAVTVLVEAHRAHDVDGRGAVDPTREASRIASAQVMAARQYRHPGARRRGPVEDYVRQVAARMARHDEVGGADRNRVEPCLDELDTTLEPWPRLDERLVQLRRRGRQRLVRPPGRVETCRRGSAAPGRAVRVPHPGRRCARRGRGGEHASPPPMLRRAPCGAGSRRGRRPGPSRRTACRPGTGQGPDRSGAREMTVRTRGPIIPFSAGRQHRGPVSRPRNQGGRVLS